MSIFNRFNRFKQVIHFRNEKEEAVFTRTGRSNGSNFKNNFVYTTLLKNDTKLENGMLFTCNFFGEKTTFIVVAVRKSEASVQATVYECNCVAQIYRLKEKFDKHDNLLGSELSLITETPANYVTVNATMRLLDAGLLPSTTVEVRMPVCNLRMLDRIVIDGRKYCVDVIDTTKFYGMYAVQLSYDDRSL